MVLLVLLKPAYQSGTVISHFGKSWHHIHLKSAEKGLLEQNYDYVGDTVSRISICKMQALQR